jgi:hypothetical protein
MFIDVTGRGRVRTLAGGLTAAVAVGILAGPAAAGGAEPQEVDGNPRCPTGYAGLKVEPVKSGTYTDGTLRVTLDVQASTRTVAFTSNLGVDKVIVKGGPAANVYAFSPEARSGSGLHAPVNASGGWAGLSHVDFCYDGKEEPPKPEPPKEEPPKEEPPKPEPPKEQPPKEQPPTEQPPKEQPPAQTPPQPTVAAAVAGTRVAAPRIEATSTRVASGRAVLATPSRCQTGTYRVTVRGRSMRSVAFYVNGRRVRTVSVPRGRTTVTVRLGSKAKVHRVRARVTYVASARTRARDLRATILRCSPASARPTFTG